MKTVEEINWSKQLLFASPGLKDYFDSADWTNFVKLLQIDIDAIVDIRMVS